MMNEENQQAGCEHCEPQTPAQTETPVSKTSRRSPRFRSLVPPPAPLSEEVPEAPPSSEAEPAPLSEEAPEVPPVPEAPPAPEVPPQAQTKQEPEAELWDD